MRLREAYFAYDLSRFRKMSPENVNVMDEDDTETPNAGNARHAPCQGFNGSVFFFLRWVIYKLNCLDDAQYGPVSVTTIFFEYQDTARVF